MLMQEAEAGLSVLDKNTARSRYAARILAMWVSAVGHLLASRLRLHVRRVCAELRFAQLQKISWCKTTA